MNKINVEIGARPELIWIEVDEIDVDSNYQRELKPYLVKTILDNFRWDHFGAVVLVRQETGRYHVTDGQHRAKAASLHPNISQVPALIIGASGVEAEAENFLAINQVRQSVGAVDRYWAGVTAGDLQCLQTAAVLKSADCDVVPRLGELGVNLTSSVTAVHRAIKKYGDNAVMGALLCIRETWPTNKQALRGTLITTLARLIRFNEELDQDRLVDVLRAQNFASFTADAETLRKISGGSAESNLAKTIAAEYNKKLPGKERIVAGAKK